MIDPLARAGLPSSQRLRCMAVIFVGITMAVFDATLINLALPAITRDLATTPSTSIWVVNAFQVTALAMLLPASALGDRIGYRRVYLTGVAVVTAGSAACFAASSINELVVARAVQGVGAAGVLGVNAALVRLAYPSHLLGRAIALTAVVVAASYGAAPVVAAAVLSIAPWKWLFFFDLPLGVIVLALGYRELPRNVDGFEAVPALLMSDLALHVSAFILVFVAAELLRLSFSSIIPWEGLFIALATAAAVCLAYVYRQWSKPLPLLPLDLLRDRLIALSISTSVIAFLSQTLTQIALPFLMLEAWNFTALQSGIVLASWPFAIVAAAPISGRLIGRVSAGALGAVGLSILAIGLGLLVVLPPYPTVLEVAWRLALSGFGFGVFQTPNNHVVMIHAPLKRSGAAGGLLGTARLTGQSIAAVAAAALFSLSLPNGWTGAQLAIVLACLCAGIAATFSALRQRIS